MNIIEESFIEKEKKEKKIGKMKKIILAVIIILLLCIIGIVAALFSFREVQTTALVDGQPNNDVLNVLRIEEDGTIYVPIKRISKFIGYEAYNGEYKNKSEEASKCYVVNDNEAVNLSLNDKRIYQIDLTGDTDVYRYTDMREPVRAFNGELYINSEEMENVFNTSLKYDVSTKQVQIETLTYKVLQYNSLVLGYGYEQLDETFVNQKAIFDNMLVVRKDRDNVGIIDERTGELIVDTKYKSIEYLPGLEDCIVEANNKYGVVSPKERKTKVQVNYNKIELIDKDAGLYM